MHPLMLLLFLFSITFGALRGVPASRGMVLWLLILAAVVVRETARALASIWCGMHLQSLVLSPIGAAAEYGMREDRRQKHDLLMALAGPCANLFCGIALLMITLAVSPSIHMFERPWVTPEQLMRALAWSQILLGLLHLVPAYPLDAGVVLRHQFMRVRGALSGARASSGISQLVGFALLFSGLAFQNVWTIAMGAYILSGAPAPLPVEEGENASDSPVETVKMRDVMLREFTTLGASDTLEEALEASVHSLQDIFPVTRGPLLVGSISRQAIAEALQTTGNNYVQGIMNRSLAIAQADDAVVATLRKLSSGSGTQMLPVVENERVIGIVTPQNLSSAMGLLGRAHRMSRAVSE